MIPDSSTPCRTLVKALSWETFSTIATFILAWFMFGNLDMCIAFAAACFVLKLTLFCVHERLWHQTTWGKRNETEI